MSFAELLLPAIPAMEVADGFKENGKSESQGREVGREREGGDFLRLRWCPLQNVARVELLLRVRRVVPRWVSNKVTVTVVGVEEVAPTCISFPFTISFELLCLYRDRA